VIRNLRKVMPLLPCGLTGYLLPSLIPDYGAVVGNFLLRAPSRKALTLASVSFSVFAEKPILAIIVSCVSLSGYPL